VGNFRTHIYRDCLIPILVKHFVELSARRLVRELSIKPPRIDWSANRLTASCFEIDRTGICRAA